MDTLNQYKLQILIALFIINVTHYLWRKQTKNTEKVFPARVAIWFLNAMVIYSVITSVVNNKEKEEHINFINTTLYPNEEVTITKSKSMAPFLYDDEHSKYAHYYLIEHKKTDQVEKLRLEQNNSKYIHETKEIYQADTKENIDKD